MKKLISLVSGVVLAASLTACSSSQSSSGKADDKITVWTQAAADHPEGKMFADRVKSYNEKHPDGPKVEIKNITRAGAGSGYIDKLNAAITANDVPDIFTLDGPDVAAYVESGVIAPLDDYMSQGFKDGFTKAIVEQGTVGGKFYAMGYSDSGVAIMYNEDMIKALPADVQAMVPGPDKDWTWDQFVALARKVDDFAQTTKDPAFKNYEISTSLLLTDISAGAYELGTYYFTPLLWGNGTNIVDKDGVTVDGVLNGKKSVEALTKFGQLFAGKPLANAAESEKTFYTGKSALAVAGFWYVNEIKSNYPNLKFRTLRYPKMDASQTGLYTPSGSWTFVRSAKNKDEKRVKKVVEVMEWLNNDEASKEYYEKNGSIPTRINSVSAINTNTDNPYYNEAWKVLKYQVENTNKARPVSPGYPYLSETFAKDVILKIAQNKASDSATIQKYADEAAKKIDAEFKKYKK
ncbi:ABC transporter substrate-binding protein [Ectobacillus ponti]|uniref:Sugar ABC transporter substrate-binding protein n=1 Tax=Ectobacillus ponti TaxID=2961894 RepID=A0AA42BQV9_9BACI|nr:sugar ABC transporter substrate-binding protein [Ectobacillus ponti]MCP8970675.1 sugar ABC transporter substrate-binding protein [Ectobacillus ponti]